MSTTNASGAERFRVERWKEPPSVGCHSWLKAAPHGNTFYVAGKEDLGNENSMAMHLCVDGAWRANCNNGPCTHGWFPTEAEANFRLLLATSPHLALNGECRDCAINGYWPEGSCPTCHGTGGAPSADLLNIAADFYGDETMEGSVLRGLGKQ